MSLAKIVYASMTGNTEGISEILEKSFQDKNWEVERLEADEADEDFFDDADICVVATYTYDEGEVPFDFEDFYENLSEQNLSGKVFGVVGSGDSELYPDDFCRAADKFEEAFDNSGAVKGSNTVKIENDADKTDEQKLNNFVDELISKK